MRLALGGGAALRGRAVLLGQGGVIKRRDGDDDVDDDHEEALEVVALLIAQEVAHGDDGEDEHDEVEDVKVEPHVKLHAPADNNNKRPIEEGRLQGRAEDVRQGEVHLVVPRLVDGRDVLGRLLHQRHEDQAHEGVRDAVVLDDVGDLLDQGYGDDADQRDPARLCVSDEVFTFRGGGGSLCCACWQTLVPGSLPRAVALERRVHVRYHERNHTLGERKLRLVGILVGIVVPLLVIFKHCFVNTMML